MLNLAMITGIVLAARSADHSPVWVAAAVLVGGACQILFQVPAALRRGWRPRLRVAPKDPGVRHIGALMLPGVPGLAATQVNVLVNLFLASFLASGSVAAITYAFRLVQFPIGTLAVPIATGALPVFARSFAGGQLDEMKQSLRDSLRLAIFVTLPAMVGLIVFAAPTIAVLLEYGTFSRSSTLLTASALMAYGTGLLFYVANRILGPAFFAMHDTWTPAFSAMLGVAVNILVSLALLRPLGIVGLALATAAASAANCAFLVARLRRRVGGIGGRRVARTAAFAALACLPMVAWGLLAPGWLDVLAVSSKAVRALYLATQLAVAVGLYLGTAALLKSEELRWAVELLSRKKPSRQV
jgi:putative peptidoglycan lipid II flippase